MRKVIVPIVMCCVAASLGSLFVGCGSSSGDRISIPATSRTVTIRVGDTGAVDVNTSGQGDVLLALSEVTEDSRCGLNESCFLPGTVHVKVSLSGIGWAVPSFIMGNDKAAEIPASGSRPGYRIEIAGVAPSKQTIRETVPQKNYRITFQVQRLP